LYNGTDLCFFSFWQDISLHCESTHTALVHREMGPFSVYAPAIAGIHCTYLWKDGQAELKG